MRRLILFAAAAAVAVVLSAPAAASATTADYQLVGTGTVTPGLGCLDCTPPTMDAAGTVACALCLPGKPESGTFSVATIVSTFPPSPCKVKGVTGTLQVLWSNGSVSTTSVSGKFRDSKTLALAGTFFPTDLVFPTDPTKVTLNNYPPNPCTAATNAITGALAITVG
jgi:hypothetical protein